MLDVLLDKKLASELGIILAERPSIPTTKMRVVKTTIDGRDSTIIEEKGFEDRPLVLRFNILEEKNIKQTLRVAKATLINLSTIQFNDDTTYQKVKTIEIGNIENEVEFYGIFDVSLELDPFDYDISKKVETITGIKEVENIGTINSKPLIKVFGKGECGLKINGEDITIKDVSDFVYLDCDLKECYRGDKNMNQGMTGNYPIFHPGKNEVSFSKGTTKLEVETRCRYI